MVSRVHGMIKALALLALPAGLAGCAVAQEPIDPDVPKYGPIVIADLGEDLIQVKFSIREPAEMEDVVRVADCNAASYAMSLGMGFARHLRTNAYKDSGLWRADAVYSVSPELPRGLNPLDAFALKADCARTGIPMV